LELWLSDSIAILSHVGQNHRKLQFESETK